MDLVIDQANIHSFLSSSESEKRDECTRLIKNGINVIFNFDKSDVNVSSEDGQKLLMWLRLFTQGLKTHAPQWGKRVDTASIKTNFPTTLSAKGKRDIYLLNNKEVIEKIKDKGAILIGSLGDEIALLSSLILENTEVPAISIQSWSDYIPDIPVTDIIICDNHYFKNKYVFEANEHELVKALCKMPNQSPVNCIIISKKGEVDRELDITSELQKLKKIIKEITGSTKSTVTFMLTYRTHDRNTVTNYFRLKCGSCYHLKDNNLKPDVTAEIKTHANITNGEISNYLLSQYQQIIDNNKNDIVGDKKSNFLIFPD